MALTALHVTFLWNANKAGERMELLKSEMETDLSVTIEDADLFNSIVGEDVMNMFDMFKLNPSAKDGTLTKRQCEDVVCFTTALAEVYLMVPIERQPTLTDTLFKTGVTSLFMNLMKAKCPSLPLSESMLLSTMQTSIATLLISMSTKKCEDDITRIEYTHQRLCRQFLPELQHMIYNSTCLATVLVMLKYSLVIGSTHKPFFREVFNEFSGVVEEFLKPGVLAAHWSRRIGPKQQMLLKALTPYMPGEINCFVNIISWLIYEIPKRGMIEDDLDLVMARPSLLDSYWRLLNEPIPSTYFRFAKSKIMMLYSCLCEESPAYSKALIDKYGVCPFLDQIVGDQKIDAKSRFPLSCLVNNLIIAMNPLHEDCLFPMDQAMEKLYEDYGKNDPLIQSEILGYIPGIKKTAQNAISENLINLANDMAGAYDSDTKLKSDGEDIKRVRFDDVNTKESVEPPQDSNLESSTSASSLQVYLEAKYGSDYSQYLPAYVNNGLYATNKRKMFYNCLEETNRSMLAAVCSQCNTSLNKQFCKDCYFPYCSTKCENDDKDFHHIYCNLKSLERSLHEASVTSVS